MQKKVSVLVFALLVFVHSGAIAQNFDINILEKLNRVEETYCVSRVVSNTSSYLEAGVPVLIVGAALLGNNDALLKTGLYIGASFCVNIAATYAVKHIVRRPRPRITYPDRIIWYEDMRTNSFPSGHTSAAFNTATSLTVSFPKWYVIAPSFLWASFVGYSRMNLGVHYPSDVLCGAALGSASALLTWKANNWFRSRHKNRLLRNKKLESEPAWY
ncbi:MAG: phosphatase PAP2 family protein [Prevotellaceae bacterium]|nr:phosphatase PAP2 family protein [Prevotellaceae bacterium]